MELGQLRVFLTVMDTGSVTRAAEMVGLSAGAVSQQLRALGADLGVELFVRAGRKIAPTAHALRLSEHAPAILNQVGHRALDFSKDEARASRAKIVRLELEEVSAAQFLLYPRRSNMRLSIDTFFHEMGISPRVIMEADDTEAIKRLVESGFGYSILPEFSLRGQSRFLELFRVAGHRLVRRQALAMPRTEYPRPLTQSIAGVIHDTLVRS